MKITCSSFENLIEEINFYYRKEIRNRNLAKAIFLFDHHLVVALPSFKG